MMARKSNQGTSVKRIRNFLDKSQELRLPLKHIKTIEEFTKELGGQTFIIGGNVRDLILGNKMSSDCDLVINAKIDKLMKILDKHNISFSTVGLKFGTIIIQFKNQNIEVTAMRQDKKTDGRWAEIKYTNNIEVDAKRRDFTINSIYCDLNGNLFDPLNGLDDLKKKIVRFIGDPAKRIEEDHLRILRFLRFSYQISDSFDSKGLFECERNINKILKLSWERRISEIKKILIMKRIERIDKVDNKKIGKFIEIALEKKINFENFQLLCKQERETNLVSSIRRLKYLLRDESFNNTDYIIKKSSKEFRDRIVSKVDLKDYSNKEINKLLYKINKENVIDELFFDFVRNKITKSLFTDKLNFVHSHIIKKLPISGNNLIDLGFREGEQIGEYLKSVKDWWLENNCKPNRVECIEYLKSLPGSKRGQ